MLKHSMAQHTMAWHGTPWHSTTTALLLHPAVGIPTLSPQLHLLQFMPGTAQRDTAHPNNSTAAPLCYREPPSLPTAGAAGADSNAWFISWQLLSQLLGMIPKLQPSK